MSSTVREINFSELPDDMIYEICAKLNSKELLKLIKKNKNVYRACSDELSRRKAFHIKYRQKMALPLMGKCDNPRRLLKLICEGMMMLKENNLLALRIVQYIPDYEFDDDSDKNNMEEYEVNYYYLEFDTRISKWSLTSKFTSKYAKNILNIHKKLLSLLNRRKRGSKWNVVVRERNSMHELFSNNVQD